MMGFQFSSCVTQITFAPMSHSEMSATHITMQ